MFQENKGEEKSNISPIFYPSLKEKKKKSKESDTIKIGSTENIRFRESEKQEKEEEEEHSSSGSSSSSSIFSSKSISPNLKISSLPLQSSQLYLPNYSSSQKNSQPNSKIMPESVYSLPFNTSPSSFSSSSSSNLQIEKTSQFAPIHSQFFSSTTPSTDLQAPSSPTLPPLEKTEKPEPIYQSIMNEDKSVEDPSKSENDSNLFDFMQIHPSFIFLQIHYIPFQSAPISNLFYSSHLSNSIFFLLFCFSN